MKDVLTCKYSYSCPTLLLRIEEKFQNDSVDKKWLLTNYHNLLFLPTLYKAKIAESYEI